MSGYFARLAAQMASPAVTPGARTTLSTSLLEQHDEVTAHVAATAPPLSLSEARQTSSLLATLPKQQAKTTSEAPTMARPAEPLTKAPADTLPLPDAMAWPVHLQPSQPALASTLTHAKKEASADKALAPLTTNRTNTASSSPWQTRDMPVPQVTPDRLKEAPPILASPSSLDLPRPKTATQEQSQSQSPAWQAPEQVAPVESSFKVRPVRPVQPDHQRESPTTIKSSNPVEAMPRTHVSIGTITLEVRAANPAPVTTPEPQPVADPTPAPARFALRRHHVRWS
ncbi:hypothetical protein [Aquabacterium sp.]|uniref:hypothetical protein n=1 Tax=Aquabacterium sp. TaxID=1872578 RepID=UPI0019AB794A|nr:hypothetical protein [Aquabacterium sp.]MBC7700215.1 hypothetical protein [Aquabacterium sp.]